MPKPHLIKAAASCSATTLNFCVEASFNQAQSKTQVLNRAAYGYRRCLYDNIYWQWACQLV